MGDKGYKSVGVLRFRVQKGSRKPSFDACSLCDGMTTRLENCLILSCDPKDEDKTARVIRGAARTANARGIKQWYSKPDQRQKLFGQSYQQAWGNQSVKPDCLLTGLIVNKGDRKKTTVTILALARKNPSKPDKVLSFEVDTDRMLLRDLGYNVIVANRSKRRRVSAREMDQQAVNQVKQQEQQGQKNKNGTKNGGKTGQQGGQVTPESFFGFQFKIFYDGQTQTIRKLGQQQGDDNSDAKSTQFVVNPVTAGKKVVFTLARMNAPTEKRMGAVIRVNGQSTWKEEDTEPMSCHRWLYDASDKGKPDKFEGFYYDLKGTNLKRFKVLSEDESKTKQGQLSRPGWIDVDIFESGDAPDESTEMKISTRSPGKRGKGMKLAEVQRRIAQANGISLSSKTGKPGVGARSKVRRRDAGGLIFREVEAVEGGLITSAQFPNPRHLGGISIKYYDAGSKGGDMKISE
jgi:hypothetical protein